MQTMKEDGATVWVANETTMIGATIIDSEINIALVAGGASGSLLVILALFLLTVLALLWVIRKRQRCVNETESYNHHHHQMQSEEDDNPRVRTVHIEGKGDQSVKMNNNCAYDKLDSLIPTVKNVAYNSSISDKHEYDYVIY